MLPPRRLNIFRKARTVGQAGTDCGDLRQKTIGRRKDRLPRRRGRAGQGSGPSSGRCAVGHGGFPVGISVRVHHFCEKKELLWQKN